MRESLQRSKQMYCLSRNMPRHSAYGGLVCEQCSQDQLQPWVVLRRNSQVTYGTAVAFYEAQKVWHMAASKRFDQEEARTHVGLPGQDTVEP